MTTDQRNTAGAMADAIAERLASPSNVRGLGPKGGWWPQSLAVGAAGVALLHIERARADRAAWQVAHDWLAYAAHGDVSSGGDSHLYYGAPAIAFALHAAADRPGRYTRALHNLDQHIAATTRRRLYDAHARIDRRQLPALAEFDTIRGLSGIGAYLLRRDPGGDLVRAVLAYLVRLTEPINDDGETLPGWWSGLGPGGKPSAGFPGGHSNNALAHGIGGPLAILSLALRTGVAVDGQSEAIARICAWLDQWRQDTGTGPRWPYWITRAQLRNGHCGEVGPSRPSWCYGSAGLGRVQQLTALVTGDTERQRMAEVALSSALADPGQLAAITDRSLCHGFAGLLHIALRASSDAITPALAACVPPLLAAVVPQDADSGVLVSSLLRSPDGDAGFLEGASGVALALESARTGALPVSGWDSCLLIN